MIKRIFFTLSLVGMCLLAAPQTASAANLFSGVDCSKASGSAICHEKTAKNSGQRNPLTGCPDQCGSGLLTKIANIIAYIAGAAAIIIIIVGAIRLITSGSDTSKGGRVDEDVEKARRSIASALLGLAIIVLARTIIVYVIKRL